MSERMHQIGEVAEAVGLSLRTIRYYEEADLAPPSGRTAGGFRLYTDRDIERLRLVKNMKPLDLSIEEMRELLSVRDQLADGRVSSRKRDVLLERLAMFGALAQERCERLREQLRNAEAVSDTINGEVRAASRTKSPSRR